VTEHRQAVRQIGHHPQQLVGRLVATTDPDADTASVLAEYARHIGAHWTFATGSAAALVAFWKPFQVDLATAENVNDGHRARRPRRAVEKAAILPRARHYFAVSFTRDG